MFLAAVLGASSAYNYEFGMNERIHVSEDDKSKYIAWVVLFEGNGHLEETTTTFKLMWRLILLMNAL